ncbi:MULTISPECIES: ArsR/SmtB family transcription factor [Exiguobacterium]|nr:MULTISPECIES: metalloregulator ArsR/SmtB family transcription factor [Exiguobacterium]AHA29626.1 ArsR family transcriptional regulator [Exiguobacterium sp. MH3]
MFKRLNGGAMRKNEQDVQALDAAVGYFQDAIPIFQVLSDVNRQAIIIELARYDRLNVSQLDEKISLSRPAISHHLKVLRAAGIVASEKVGTENYYYLTLQEAVNVLKTLTAAIEEDCILR